jgi:hypothetical protein
MIYDVYEAEVVRRAETPRARRTSRAAVIATGPLADPTAQASAHNLLAFAYTRLGRLDDAHTQLRHALDLATRSVTRPTPASARR